MCCDGHGLLVSLSETQVAGFQANEQGAPSQGCGIRGSLATGSSVAGRRERRAGPKVISTTRAARASTAVKARWLATWSIAGAAKTETHMLAKVWKSIASRMLPRVLLKSQVKRIAPATEP